MKKRIKKACAVMMLGTLLVGSIPMYQGFAASKNLKVNSKNITLAVGEKKTLSANMTATFKTSNKKVVSLKNVKKNKCTLVAKKQGNCTITVKAKNKKTIKVKIKVKKKSPKVTVKPVVTVLPTATSTIIPMPTADKTDTPVNTMLPQETESVKEDTDTIGGKVNNLGYNLSKLLTQTEEKDGNRVISSYSILMALTMLDNGANGETKAEIEKALGITDLDAWNEEFSKYFKNNCNDTIQNHDVNEKDDPNNKLYYKDLRFKPELSCANSFWYNDSQFSFDSKVQQDYMNKIKTNYLAQCMPLDFSNPKRNPKDDINQWVEEKTNQKIKNLLSDDLKKDETEAVLVNTLYFNGCWDNTFDEYRTRKKDFYGKNKTTKVDMMQQSEEYYSYYEQGSIMGLELPFYGDSDLVMDVITSKEQNKDGISLYEQMSNIEKNEFYQSLGNAKEQLVNLQLPKFKLEYGTVNITNQLKELGMKLAFDEYYADFPGIRGENIDNIYVDSVMHKAVIEVGESGATAAAATAIIMDNATAIDPSKKPAPIEFNVNRPFVFAIRDKQTNMIYFMGQIANLDNQETNLDSSASSTTVESQPTEQPDVKTQLLSERNMKDFKFEGECSVRKGEKYIKYQGEITKESVKNDLWNLICKQEKEECYQEGTIGGGLKLKLTDKATGEVITVGYTIWYEQPEVDGGSICFVVSGVNTEGRYHISQNEREQKFDELIEEGVVCDKNMVEN